MPLTPQYPINEESQYQWENSIASESMRILEIAEMSSDAPRSGAIELTLLACA
jgi:hypothetical protein